jgi:hypothetical protein
MNDTSRPKERLQKTTISCAFGRMLVSIRTKSLPDISSALFKIECVQYSKHELGLRILKSGSDSLLLISSTSPKGKKEKSSMPRENVNREENG